MREAGRQGDRRTERVKERRRDGERVIGVQEVKYKGEERGERKKGEGGRETGDEGRKW